MIHFVNLKILLIGCLISSAIASFFSAAYSTPRQCVPIAYVLTKSDKRFKPGDILCVGDRIELREAQFLLVFCFATGKVVELPNGQISPTGCGLSQEDKPQACGNNLTFCVRPRGNITARLKITEPDSSHIVNLRPRFSWQGIPEATSYRVRLLGNIAWSKATTQPRLSYPTNQPSLKPGSAYRVIVSAYRENQMILSGEQTLNVLSSNQAAPISTKADQK
ncbi:MAG: hypothetical protein MUC48_14050 [Leptolyngbya sp. Prado105]|nr:hypothetical protein [Leptolyngbya sp. Prado105]